MILFMSWKGGALAANDSIVLKRGYALRSFDMAVTAGKIAFI